MPATVTDIYRYPVKGLSGEKLVETRLSPGQTITGDRIFALGRPGFSFNIENPVWMPKTNFLALVRDAQLAELTTRYDDASNTLTVRLDGNEVIAADLSSADGRAQLETFIERFMADEISGAPTLLKADGHSFSDLDDKVISLINLESVRELNKKTGADTNPLRFRGNVYFDGVPAWDELDWVDRELTIGETRLKVIKRTRRCAATKVNPDTAIRDKNIPATLQKNWGHADLGIYARVINAGTLRPGDSLKLSS